MFLIRSLSAWTVSLALAAVALAQEPGPLRVTVKIQEEKTVVVEAEAPVENVETIRLQFQGNFFIQVMTTQNQTLHLSHFPTFKIDGQAIMPGNGGQFITMNGPLPKSASGKVRKGYMNVWQMGDLRITQTVELTPTKPSTPGGKRQYGAVLVKYLLENIGKQARQVGMRTYMDPYVVSNDACQFAAPNRPGKILDGVEFKDKDMPDYVQLLERSDLKNPGYVAHLTFNLGLADKADRLVLSRHGSARDNWDMQVIGGGGDSALGFWFNPKEIKPGGKRELAYAYGQAVASPLSAEGRFKFDLTGSCEPGRLSTIAAQVVDPMPGQPLLLELPSGLELVEGKTILPVQQPLPDSPFSMVLWKCRVRELGAHPIRLRSNNGVTQTKVLTLTKG